MEYIEPSMEFFIIDEEEDIITTSAETGIIIDNNGELDNGDSFGNL